MLLGIYDIDMEITSENYHIMFIKLIFLPTIIILFLRPKWLFYFLIFSLLEPTRTFSLGNYVILGSVNIKFYEIILTLIYLSALWGRKRKLRECFDKTLVVFMAFALLSLIRGLIAGFGESAFNYFRTLYAMGMYIAVPLMFEDRKELFKVLKFFFIASVAMGFIELLTATRVISLARFMRPDHRFTSFLSATQGAILAMPFLFIFSTIKYVRRTPILTFGGSIFCFGTAVWSASRGVWLGLIACTSVIITLLDLKRKVVVSLLVVLLALFVFVFSRHMYVERYDTNIWNRFKSIVDSKQGTATWRLNAWWQMVQDIKQHPVIGCPFGTPSTFYVFYMGYFEEHAPHNEYLKIARYTGLLGLGVFLIFIVRIFLSGFQYMKRNPDTKSYYEVLGFLMCFLFHCVTAMFTQAFTTMVRSPFVWAIPGVIALYILLEKEEKIKLETENLKLEA